MFPNRRTNAWHSHPTHARPELPLESKEHCHSTPVLDGTTAVQADADEMELQISLTLIQETDTRREVNGGKVKTYQVVESEEHRAIVH